MSATRPRLGLSLRRPMIITVGVLVLAVFPDRLPAVDLSEATTLFRTGEYAQCAEAAAAAIEEGQYSETWRLLKIRADMATGRYAEALATLEAALQRYRTSVRLRWLGSRVLKYNGQAAKAEAMLDEIDVLTDGYSWRYSDPASRVTLGRFYLSRGADPKKIMDGVYGAVKKRNPSYTEVYLAAGQLALEKQDFQLAAEEFGIALKQDTSDPEIHFGLARAFASSDSEKANSHLQAALQRNPRHVDSLLLLVDHHIDAERYDEARRVLHEVFSIQVREPRAWAYVAVLAHLDGDSVGEQVARSLGLENWPENPDVDFLIGKKLAQKYRFAEAAVYQRQALKKQPDFLSAKFELSQALLRLGEEEEGLRLANEVNRQDGYHVVAHNLVALQDKLTRFETLEVPGFVLRMEPLEAQLYGQRALRLLVKAKETLCPKYDVTIDQPVLVEIFPRQADFAIRTFGLPGGDGFLGVCFGRVITANSPASRGSSPANWESVLWHEFCHVVTLEKTRNKMPRWLSEGISVYEERQADPRWGQTMTPTYRQMILDGELTPVSQLSGAFLQPKSAMHLQFAYYESSLVVEFLIANHGIETLHRVLDDLAVGMSLNESLTRYTGSLAALDREFAEFATERANQLAPQADWAAADLPRGVDVATLRAWLQTHPRHFVAKSRLAQALVEQERWEEAKTILTELVALYPEFHEPGNAYALLAEVHAGLGETNEERAVLETLTRMSDDDVDALERLMTLCVEQQDWPAALDAGDRILGINPLLAAPHRVIATAAEHLDDRGRAITALRALVALDPIDPAQVHYRLARHLTATGELPAAKHEVLQALEEAPRFRAAHRQLLAIVDRLAATEMPPAGQQVPAAPGPDAGQLGEEQPDAVPSSQTPRLNR